MRGVIQIQEEHKVEIQSLPCSCLQIQNQVIIDYCIDVPVCGIRQSVFLFLLLLFTVKEKEH